MCEGPTEPSDTSGGHSSALKHTTTTKTKLDLKGDRHGVSKQSQGHGMGSSEAAVFGKRMGLHEKERKTGNKEREQKLQAGEGTSGKDVLT